VSPPFVPSRILCPECATALAWSPGLVGKTVQCPQCAHRFTVSGPPVEELPVAVLEPEEEERVLVPPPLPAREISERPPVAERDEPAENRPRRRPARRERPGNAGVLAGLAAAFVLGSAAIVGGLVYMLWPTSSKPTNPAGEGPTPATAAPVTQEPVKRYEDIIREAPHKDDNRGRPGPEIQQFNPVPIGPRPDPVPPAPGRQPPVAMPQFPPAPGRPAADGPKFAEAIPLPIRPARLAPDRDEIVLPGPVESVAVAGGGRLLLMHLPRTKRVLVFDVIAAKVVKEIAAPDPETMLAGGMNLFVIYQPGKNTIERWNCDDLTRLPEVKSPFKDPVFGLAMGCASNGPLVAALGGKRKAFHGGSTLAYFGPGTMKEVTYAVQGDRNAFGLGEENKRVQLRVSANGGVVTGWGHDTGAGAQCDELRGAGLVRHWNLLAPRPLLPAADGSLLFAPGQVLRPGVYGDGPLRNSATHYVPAASGNWHSIILVARAGGRGEDDRAKTLAVYQTGRNVPAATFDAVDDIDLSRGEQGFDQSVILVPEAKVLITVTGPTRTKLALRPVDLK
jgi:hypothetical protein